MKRLAVLLLVAGCASPAPRDSARLQVRYYDASGALAETHELVVGIERRFVAEVKGVQYRFTLHQDYTVSL